MSHFTRSATLWTLVTHLVGAAIVATRLAPSASYYYASTPRAFVLTLLLLRVLPRLLGWCIGRSGARAVTIHSDAPAQNLQNAQKLPEGYWVLFGNPWPEYAVAFHPSYPTAAGEEVRGIDYLQVPTLLGLLSFVPHVLAQLLWSVRTSQRSVTSVSGNYFMPEIDASRSRILSATRLASTSDPRVWARTRKSWTSERALYVWVHESHPGLPWDDWVQFSSRPYDAPLQTFATSLLCMALPLLAFAWSHGALLVVVAFEPLVRTLVARGWW